MWRVGRKVGRTIYDQKGPRPHDKDELIGMMDTPELAREAVAAVNGESEVREALAELVRLKDGPRDEAYERDKPLAWERARIVLGIED